jgi:PII-like signaling protein
MNELMEIEKIKGVSNINGENACLVRNWRTRYRIYTENKNRMDIIETVQRFCLGFTVFHAFGFWKGDGEMSIVIEVIDADPKYIASLAMWIKEYNNQDAVMVTVDQVEVIFF